MIIHIILFKTIIRTTFLMPSEPDKQSIGLPSSRTLVSLKPVEMG